MLVVHIKRNYVRFTSSVNKEKKDAGTQQGGPGALL